MRLPPRIKILEALSAIADGRIKALDDKEAEVISSDGQRTYRVYLDLARGLAYSDDNGTKYRGYIGYPIVAFMMLKGALPVDNELKDALRGIPWRRLNEQYKKYDVVIEVVKRELSRKGIDPSRVDRYIHEVVEKLRTIKLELIEQGAEKF
ncbi:hypothetical protein [Thermoproteus tenax]|uniref:Uncharacterized protein n=1 Tax=Thermoproteus tenax (strain ATCC 35583 / DSM 2078 / JCM 9277 / NBRC 100435 / Kra 1) TaxID=768679 RepID=G4RL95_THETK|nr:hypothetical protein [Thermoproteus tenax]CCC82340.1 conserved hypothetical protein [Thermoproteus tenax Kra 1]